MSPETILIASAVLGILLVPSLITGARPTYSDPDDLQIESTSLAKPTE